MDNDTYERQYGDHVLIIQRSSVQTGDKEGITYYDATMRDTFGDMASQTARITSDEADKLILEWNDADKDMYYQDDSIMGQHFTNFMP